MRCRHLIEHVLQLDGFRGILAYTLPEALWLAACGTSDDIVVAYPTTDRSALGRLAGDATAAKESAEKAEQTLHQIHNHSVLTVFPSVMTENEKLLARLAAGK